MNPYSLYMKFASDDGHDMPFGPSTQAGAMGGAALGAAIGMKQRLGPVRMGAAGALIGGAIPALMGTDIAAEHLKKYVT